MKKYKDKLSPPGLERSKDYLAFRDMKEAGKLEKFVGKWISFVDCKHILTEPDRETLLDKLNEKYPRKGFFLTYVPNPKEEYDEEEMICIFPRKFTPRVKSVDSWRKYYLNLGKKYAKNIPAWVKTEEIMLMPTRDVSRKNVYYAKKLMVDFLEYLKSKGFPANIKIKLGNTCNESEFKELCKDPNRSAAYALIAEEELISKGYGDFEKGIIETWSNTHNKLDMKYTNIHELCEMLTPNEFKHCEDHPPLKGYRINKYCALSITAGCKIVIDKEDSISLCEQCRDGMNYFWKGLKS